MDLVQQVCSLELAQKLKELGVKQESLWYWLKISELDEQYVIRFSNKICEHWEHYSAFTVAELGEMLKESEWRLPYVRENGRWWNGGFDDEPTSATEADARAKCLIYLLENHKIQL